ncbi:Clp1-domain-containing protein [Daldinia caldariorum]|uniref:Clp1-domain-containing protein n=1 Tax=Daldinia caldariorum TaxID=326644 RepID=UPI0020081122|nr:Clp1-domain-containing protein [Daldinia caldariorum]KAI1470326.1 Clp1-domain-containing protein [Daldinia caldariorum]
MSIPGLGDIAPAATPVIASSSAAAPTTTETLEPFWEYRFEVPHGSTLDIKLVSGTAEKDGTELAPNTPYTFTATKSKINTWHGCTLEISSPTSNYDAYTSEPTADETPMVSYLNLHFKLEAFRTAAQRTGQMGPRVLVVGPPNAGKTSLVKMLTGWATRMGRQPLVINTDCREGMLSLPGSLSAAVFATIMDITTDWGSTPSSGPSAIPVKLPLVYNYGLGQPEENMRLYKRLLSRLAVTATSRLAEDPDVKTAGLLIDTGGVNVSKGGYDHIAHIVAEFSVNIVLVIGSERIGSEIQKKFAGQKTSLDEPITVVSLDKSGGVVERDTGFLQQVHEAAIKEYFFGGANTTLSPFTQQVDFSALSIWKINPAPAAATLDDDIYSDAMLEKVEPSLVMQNCILSVVYASVHDSTDTIRDSNVMGYVYVAEVDEKRRKLKILAPVNARLGDRPLLWGSWPEPMVSLLG